MTTDASFGAIQPSSMGIFGRGRGFSGPVVAAVTNAIKLRSVSGGKTYDVYYFNTSGSITFSDAGDVDALVVGGGGSGGTSIAGGGGAGQFIEQTIAVTATGYPITVGAGGIYPTATQVSGRNGSPTSALGLTAIGGGGGGAFQDKPALAGGASGGGGGASDNPGGVGIAGFNGGSSVGASLNIQGGGGGAGSVGSPGGTSAGNGLGGAPLSSFITGDAIFYAAGGCGAVYSGSRIVSPYSIAGYGGSNSPIVYPTPGQANTGSGGGGGGGAGYQPNGGGGSGVVIIRVEVPASSPAPDVLPLLFASGEKGFIYDPSNISTLFQDSAGTIPVTAAGQPVGQMRDITGNGIHATQSNNSKRPIYQTDGTLHWLAFNGTNQAMNTGSLTFSPSDEMSTFTAHRKLGMSLAVLIESTPFSLSQTTAAFSVLAPDNAGQPYISVSKGTVSTSAIVADSTYYAPNTALVTTLLKITGAKNTIRVNGEELVVTSTATQGTSTSWETTSYKMYIGSRSDQLNYFQGNLYGMVVRNALTYGALLTDAETAVAAKAGLTV
jgi:hypothetical protein